MTRPEEQTGQSVPSARAAERVAAGVGARDLDPCGDGEKREALVQLRDHYVEAQKLVPPGRPYENLAWLLGARRNPTQDPLGFQTKTIELVALWLEDLLVELDRQLPDSPIGEAGSSVPSDLEARQGAARTLRDATERFLLAFRSLRSDGRGPCA